MCTGYDGRPVEVVTFVSCCRPSVMSWKSLRWLERNLLKVQITRKPEQPTQSLCCLGRSTWSLIWCGGVSAVGECPEEKSNMNLSMTDSKSESQGNQSNRLEVFVAWVDRLEVWSNVEGGEEKKWKLLGAGLLCSTLVPNNAWPTPASTRHRHQSINFHFKSTTTTASPSTNQKLWLDFESTTLDN